MAMKMEDLQRRQNNSNISSNGSALDIIQIQPEKFLLDRDCQKKQKQNKLRSKSCPDARKMEKSLADDGTKASESLIIYKLYETARQRKINTLKNYSNTLVNQNKKVTKLAVVHQASNQLHQSDLSTAISDDPPLIKKSNNNRNLDENSSAITEASSFTLDQSCANRQCKSAIADSSASRITDAKNSQVTETCHANKSKLCKALVQEYNTEEEVANIAKKMIDTQLPLQSPEANGISTTECSCIPNQSARKSKRLEIDGVYYIVTREPPGRYSFRSKSVASIDVHREFNNFCRRDALFSRLANGAFINKDAMAAHCRLSKELETWYQQRESKSNEVKLSEFGPGYVTEPYKIEALDHAALRLRKLVKNLKRDVEMSKETICENLEYTIGALESNFLKLHRIEPSPTSDDEVLETLSGETPVPEEIKSWLVETFSNKKIGNDKSRSKTEHRSLRSIVRTVQAGMMFDRLSRKPAAEIAREYISPEVARHLKHIDKWTFDVFKLESISNGNALACVCYQLLTKYDLIKRFKISVPALFAFCSRLQKGYRMHNNRYHNPVHAADVAQTLNCLLTESGFINWFSDLEIFSMIMAALIHDVEHTGTTNNFHINTRSNLAILYNDRSVLEQHHVSTAFRIMKEEEGCDILANFSKDDYQDCRSIMVEMVLATDMNRHFDQMRIMENELQRPDLLEKSKAMSLLLHSSDINHPSKPWKLHYKWTEQLVLEFFDQGDRERKLDLPISPLCDRHSAKIAQSQIGFIDFVVHPTFSLLLRLFGEVNSLSNARITDENSNVDTNSDPIAPSGDILKQRFGDGEMNTIFGDRDRPAEMLGVLKDTVFACINHNKTQWVRRDKIEKEKKSIGEKAFQIDFIPDPLPATISKYCSNGGVGVIKEEPFKEFPRINKTSLNSKPP